MFWRKNTNPSVFCLQVLNEAFLVIDLYLLWAVGLYVHIRSFHSWRQLHSAHLQTRREPLWLVDILAHHILPPPSPPRFSLNQGWHHHGGTHGPPHLLPITAPQNSSTKATPNGYEMERNNLRPWENISEASRASTPSGKVLICVCDHLMQPRVKGLEGYYVRHFLDVKYTSTKETKFRYAGVPYERKTNMTLSPALSEYV